MAGGDIHAHFRGLDGGVDRDTVRGNRGFAEGKVRELDEIKSGEGERSGVGDVRPSARRGPVGAVRASPGKRRRRDVRDHLVGLDVQRDLRMATEAGDLDVGGGKRGGGGRIGEERDRSAIRPGRAVGGEGEGCTIGNGERFKSGTFGEDERAGLNGGRAGVEGLG